ncbi:unnamed protein product [Oppiella nova]|uniref:SMC hinge domain-containing protein n=1 Tax=Oppiella nova TaxID=334625 RepID=A0A7R9LAL0_9ACAR|nr:unnamed protein product [Oppiella nova]CAG2161629.1 unnamed protein product [Oppiella nova]
MLNQRHSIRAVQIHRKEICSDLVVDYVLSHFVDTNVFTEEERDFILSSGDSIGDPMDVLVRERVLHTQNETFVDLVLKKMETIDHTFTTFTYILFKDDNYPWIAKRLLALREDERRMEDMNHQMNELDLINGLPTRFEIVDHNLMATIGKPVDVSLHLYDRLNNLVIPDPNTHEPKLTIKYYKLKTIDNKLVIKNIIISGQIAESQRDYTSRLEIDIPAIGWREQVLIDLQCDRSTRPTEISIGFLVSNAIKQLDDYRVLCQREKHIVDKLQELGEDISDHNDEPNVERKLNNYKKLFVELKNEDRIRAIRGKGTPTAPKWEGVLGRVVHLAYVEDPELAKSISWFLRDHMTCIVTTTSELAQKVCEELSGVQQTLPLDCIPDHELYSPHLPSNPSISVKFATNYLKFNQEFQELDKVFAAILGNTLIIDDMEVAKRYRQLVIRDIRCPTIITKTGILYESGIIDSCLPTDIVMFQSPPNPDLIRVETVIELLKRFLFLRRKRVSESTSRYDDDRDSPPSLSPKAHSLNEPLESPAKKICTGYNFY